MGDLFILEIFHRITIRHLVAVDDDGKPNDDEQDDGNADKQQRRHRNLLAERHQPLSGYQPSPQVAHDYAMQGKLHYVLQEDAKNILHLRPVHLSYCKLLATAVHLITRIAHHSEEGDNHRYDAGYQDSVAEIELGSILVSQFRNITLHDDLFVRIHRLHLLLKL